MDPTLAAIKPDSEGYALALMSALHDTGFRLGGGRASTQVAAADAHLVGVLLHAAQSQRGQARQC